MPIFDLFSKRQKRLRGDVPDVFVYDDVPQPLRVQLVQILQDGIGPDQEYLQFYSGIHVEHVIDIVEVGLRAVDTVIRQRNWQYIGCSVSPDDTISEANSRFKEHGVGFEYISGEMIRVDSQLIHNDVVKPALKLLSDKRFKGANEEFLKAHEHYRHGRNKECLTECLKAFESTMKIICDIKGWGYQPRDTAKKLIETCMNNGLFPTFLQSHVGNLRAILESGVPTVRNKLGGHGQGSAVTSVSDATARFALHSTATNIVMFVESI